MRQPVFPVKAQPVDVVLDRLDELGAFLARVRVIQTQKSLPPVSAATPKSRQIAMTCPICR